MDVMITMNDERYLRGKAQFEKMSGGSVSAVIDSLSDLSPDLARLTVEFPYGDVVSRPGLDLRARQIATVAALGNAPVQLRAHIDIALNVGCTSDEIMGIIIQMAVYAGFPAALNAMAAAKEVFQARDKKGLN
jgi:4-carboxymuconolactone decarboxylase